MIYISHTFPAESPGPIELACLKIRRADGAELSFAFELSASRHPKDTRLTKLDVRYFPATPIPGNRTGIGVKEGQLALGELIELLIAFDEDRIIDNEEEADAPF